MFVRLLDQLLQPHPNLFQNNLLLPLLMLLN
jgi:hypothetical protein